MQVMAKFILEYKTFLHSVALHLSNYLIFERLLQ